MNQNRKLLVLLAFILLISTAFIGCVQIPEEYTKGVRLDSSYPEDDMPIYDDAVIYDSDGDDESASVKYGTQDELEDVADFYKDFIDDNDIVLDDETDKSTRYSAEGIYKNFAFEIKVSNASGDYEKKVFQTVVKVDIEFNPDSLGTISDLQNDSAVLSKDLVGFWREESFENDSGKTATYDYGTAYEFLSDGTLNLYFDFEFVGTGAWEEIDNSTLLLTAIDGSQENVTVSLEKRSEKDYLVWEDSTGTLIFFRDTSEEFGMGDDTNTPEISVPVDDNSDLSQVISDKVWYYISYTDENGKASGTSKGALTYYADGSLIDTFDDETLYGSWYVSGQRLYCDYSDGNSVSWEIEVETENGVSFLYFNSDSDPGAFWLYASAPMEMIDTSFADTIMTYTTNEDMTSSITGREFHELYYQYSDGTTEPMVSYSIMFHDDFTLSEIYKGENLTGTWAFSYGNLELYYDNGDAYYYPSKVEYCTDSEEYYLYLGDAEEGYEGCYWVFTTFKP